MNIENQLKDLKNKLDPSLESLNKGTELLTKRIEFVRSANDFDYNQSPVFFNVRIGLLRSWQFTLANMRQVVALVIIGMLSGSGVLMAKASLAAVPGDALYSVKRNIFEKAELVLAPTPEDEAAVYLKHVAARLDEIRTINQRNLSTDDKAQRINHAVLSLNRDLTAARQSIQMAAKENVKPETLVAVAKNLSNSTSNVKVALADAKRADGKNALSQSVDEALLTADSANTDSANIIIDNKDKTPVSTEDLKAAISKTLDSVSLQVKTVDEAAKLSTTWDVRSKVRQSLYEMMRDKQVASVDQSTIDNVRSQMDRANEVLAEANHSFELGSFEQAMQFANQAKDIADSVSKVLATVSSMIDVPLLPTDSLATTSTSTVKTPDKVQSDTTIKTATTTAAK